MCDDGNDKAIAATATWRQSERHLALLVIGGATAGGQQCINSIAQQHGRAT